MKRCSHCGAEMPDENRFCTECGEILPLMDEQEEAEIEALSRPIRSMNVKRIRTMAAFAAAIIMVAGIFIFTGEHNKSSAYSDKIAEANQYLENGEFEKAESSFLEATQIRPRTIDAYDGLEKVYTAQGDDEKLSLLEEKIKNNNVTKSAPAKKEKEDTRTASSGETGKKGNNNSAEDKNESNANEASRTSEDMSAQASELVNELIDGSSKNGQLSAMVDGDIDAHRIGVVAPDMISAIREDVNGDSYEDCISFSINDVDETQMSIDLYLFDKPSGELKPADSVTYSLDANHDGDETFDSEYIIFSSKNESGYFICISETQDDYNTYRTGMTIYQVDEDKLQRFSNYHTDVYEGEEDRIITEVNGEIVVDSDTIDEMDDMGEYEYDDADSNISRAYSTSASLINEAIGLAGLWISMDGIYPPYQEDVLLVEMDENNPDQSNICYVSHNYEYHYEETDNSNEEQERTYEGYGVIRDYTGI